MDHQHVLTISIVFFQILNCLADPDELYQQCASRFTCGNSTEIGFPFWGNARPSNCGIPALNLVCDYYYQYQIKIQIYNLTYSVTEIDSRRKTMKIARQDVQEACFTTPRDTSMDFTLFDYSPGYENITFNYGCSSPPAKSSMLNLSTACDVDGSSYSEVYVVTGSRRRESCSSSVTIPVVSSGVKQVGNLKGLMTSIDEGFELRWKADSDACDKCTQSKGQCGYNTSASDPFVCYCLQPPYVGKTCSSPAAARSKGALAAGIAIGAAIITGLALAGFAYFIIKRRKSIQNKSLISASSRPDHHHHHLNLQKFQPYPFKKFEVEKGSTYFGVQLFSYAELEEATDNFDPSHELGDGGFGVVYYGELFDGRQVAVKRLYERNFKSIEQFMNEVEILARLRHPNLVTLYGCTSRRSRELLLVYEYVSNGTLADHLHGRRPASTFLNWPLRLNIALETASALAYLHACDIIHRDVKTNNILLDTKFSVKVVDFGLSRLFPNDVTHVSTAPQGTPGYVDPEYYNCYQLTDKSDVYSFGVVLAELVSSKEAVDITRHRHDINLSNMAIRKIHDCLLHELVDLRLGFESDDAVKKEVTLVSELAFRCLQQDTELRPSMDDVVDVLREIAGVAGEDDGEDSKRRSKEEFFSTSPVSVVNTQWLSCSTTSNSNA